MIGLSELTAIVSRIFDDDVRNEGYIQAQVCCPRCQQREGLSEPDGKYNLEINFAQHVFRCWKCDDPKFGGSLGYLIKRTGSPFDYEEYRNLVNIYGYDIDESEEEKTYVKVTLPPEFISFRDMIDVLPAHLEPYEYLTKQRKINHEMIMQYDLGFCLEGKFKNRIIVPSYDANGDLNYFVGRAFKSWMKPTYRNPEVEKENIIANEANINWDSTLYIVEGFFDLFSVPLNTTASLGKTLSKRLYGKLKQYKPNVVVVYDPDAFKNQLEIYEMIFHLYGEEHNHRVRFVEFSGEKDIDDLRKHGGEEKVKEILRTSRGSNFNDYFKIKRNNTQIRFDYFNEPSRRFGFGELYLT